MSHLPAPAIGPQAETERLFPDRNLPKVPRVRSAPLGSSTPCDQVHSARVPALHRTFPDHFQQLLFFLGQLAFLYVTHRSRQLEAYSMPLVGFLKTRDVCASWKSATARELEAGAAAQRRGARQGPTAGGWRVRRARASRAGALRKDRPRASLARSEGGAASSARDSNWSRSRGPNQKEKSGGG